MSAVTNPALRSALAAMDAELLALMKAVVALEEAHEAAVRAVGDGEPRRGFELPVLCVACGREVDIHWTSEQSDVVVIRGGFLEWNDAGPVGYCSWTCFEARRMGTG